jgi:ribosomal protein S18 acetylase RimI-like enzyme
MHPHDIHLQVATLHRVNIDQGFLPVLGVRFLTLLYWAIDAQKDSVLFVEERDGEVVGFVAGAFGMRSIFKCMLRRPLVLFLSLLPSLFRISRVKRILEIIRFSRRRGSLPYANKPRAELLSIAVASAFRGKNLADSLYLRLQQHFLNRGLSEFWIVVGSDLAPAHRFYRRMGAKVRGEIEVHSGERSIKYVHFLDS